MHLPYLPCDLGPLLGGVEGEVRNVITEVFADTGMQVGRGTTTATLLS